MKTFVFDLDDTLIENHYLYLMPQIKFVEYVFRKSKADKKDMKVVDFLKQYVAKNGFRSIHNLSFLAEQQFGGQSRNFREIFEKEEGIDCENVKTFGFSTKRFPYSFRKALEYFSKEKDFECTESDFISVENIAREAFSLMPVMINGAEETLDFICEKGGNMVLVTKGDKILQKMKIEINQIYKWFSEEKTFIVEDKTTKVLDEVAKRTEIGLEKTWMVGNSPGSDIAPAIAIGMNAIYIPLQTWKYERDQKLPNSDKITLLKKISYIKDIYSSLKG